MKQRFSATHRVRVIGAHPTSSHMKGWFTLYPWTYVQLIGEMFGPETLSPKIFAKKGVHC